jgi:hypothetical protein
MKASELMIGDWVLYNETPQQVLEISGIDDEVYLETDELVHQSEIQPIPLTPEILEKNGFEYFHKNYSSLSYDHPFKLKMTNWPDENGLGGLWTICDIVEIRFVHQLQHALRLCEIEKEIEL